MDVWLNMNIYPHPNFDIYILKREFLNVKS